MLDTPMKLTVVAEQTDAQSRRVADVL